MVNEHSVFRFLWKAVAGGLPVVLTVQPAIPQFKPVIAWLVMKCVNNKLAVRIQDEIPELEILLKIPPIVYRDDGFARTESFMNEFYGFSKVDDGCWGRAYKFSICSYTDELLMPLKLANTWEKYGKRESRVYGLNDEAPFVYEKIYGSGTVVFRPCHRAPNIVLNLLITILLWFRCATFVLIKTRFRRCRPERIALLADYLGDPADLPVYQSFGPQNTVLVPRTPDRDPSRFPATRDLRCATWADGRFSLSGAWLAFCEVTLSLAKLAAQHIAKPSPLYRQLALLRKSWVQITALSNRFNPEVFWGRDPYNPEHILRREIFSRHGTINASINHAVPNMCKLQPHWRYVSYDRFYVFGRYVHQRYYKDTWSSSMKVVPVGTHAMTRAEWDDSEGAKPNAIGFFTAHSVGHPQVVATIRAVAERFPERKIYVQVREKHAYRADEFIRACTENCANIEIVLNRPYSIFNKISYAFSDPSTIIIEAVQRKIFTFFLDVFEDQRECLFRDFPLLPVHDPREAIRRIEEIEGGKRYDFTQLSELADMSGKYFLDILLDDLNGARARLEAPSTPEISAV